MSNPIQQVTMTFLPNGRTTKIQWSAPILGNQTTTLKLPVWFHDKAILPVIIRALDAMQYQNYAVNGPQFTTDEQNILKEIKLWEDGKLKSTVSEILGLSLYNALGAAGIMTLNTVRNNARVQGLTTNYVLRFPKDAVDLAALPWEIMRDQNETILFGGGSHSLERYIDIDIALPRPLPRGQKPHLLALLPAYNINDNDRDGERNARLAIWDRLRNDGLITFDEIGPPLTPRILNEYIRNTPKKPDVIHYFGHGIYRDGKGYLLFDGNNGIKELISAAALSARIQNVPLIVIQACKSAMVGDEGGLLTGIAPALSVDNGAVVAMQLFMRVEAATRFTEVFYEDILVKHRSLQEAVAECRKTLFFECGELQNWYVPTLYIRSREQGFVYLTQKDDI